MAGIGAVLSATPLLSTWVGSSSAGGGGDDLKALMDRYASTKVIAIAVRIVFPRKKNPLIFFHVISVSVDFVPLDRPRIGLPEQDTNGSHEPRHPFRSGVEDPHCV
jgi:hypothetical protein